MRNRRFERLVNRDVAMLDEREARAMANGLSYSITDSISVRDAPLAVLNVGAGRTCEGVVWGFWK